MVAAEEPLPDRAISPIHPQHRCSMGKLVAHDPERLEHIDGAERTAWSGVSRLWIEANGVGRPDPQRTCRAALLRQAPRGTNSGSVVSPYMRRRNLPMAKAATRRKTSSRRTPRGQGRRRKGTRYWSGRVTRESNALDLQGGVFKLKDPKRIAASLKRSAERSRRRKTEPYRSALSMLVFYINRAGKNLPASRRRTLEKAKVELRRQFGRE